MLQITKLTLKGEKKNVGKALFLFCFVLRVRVRVECVKDSYLVEHKSSQERCIIMINISSTLILDTVMYTQRGEQRTILNILLFSNFALLYFDLNVTFY